MPITFIRKPKTEQVHPLTEQVDCTSPQEALPYKLVLGDCLDVLKGMPDNYVDAIVTDPPAGISFMNKGWDHHKGGRDDWIGWMKLIAAECLRVIKPGGHALVWSLPRTEHWTATAWEDGGWEIRDKIVHLFGCLDMETQAATKDGVMPYHKCVVGQHVLCYDIETGAYSYQPILEILEYDYADTAYRIVGDFGEQVVSRNHRCIVERNGKETFTFAEACERETSVPFLESLPELQHALHGVNERTSTAKQGLRQSLLKRILFKAKTAYAQAATYLSGVQVAFQTKGGDSPKECKDVRVHLSRYFEKIHTVLLGAPTKSSFVGSFWMDRQEQDELFAEYVWGEKSCLEGRGYLPEQKRELRQSAYKVCSMPNGIPFNGEEGRLRDGTSSSGSKGFWSRIRTSRSSTSHRSRCNEQLPAEFDGIQDEHRPQEIRGWTGHKTAVVRVVPFQYTGKVWCLRVPTGAFVAVRGGVAFPTGNSGFPKSLNISKMLDKMAGAEREVVGRNPNYHSEGVRAGSGISQHGVKDGSFSNPEQAGLITAPATEEAKQWDGWGTALKPAYEAWILLRKPVEGTVAGNVLKHGVGGINIDACRIGVDPDDSNIRNPENHVRTTGSIWGNATGAEKNLGEKGRFPANVTWSCDEDEYILRGDVSDTDRKNIYKWLYENS